MGKKYRIYDDRTDKTLFVGSHFECIERLSLVDEENEMFPHLWLGTMDE